jgi:hypothetical protein
LENVESRGAQPAVVPILKFIVGNGFTLTLLMIVSLHPEAFSAMSLTVYILRLSYFFTTSERVVWDKVDPSPKFQENFVASVDDACLKVKLFLGQRPRDGTIKSASGGPETLNVFFKESRPQLSDV